MPARNTEGVILRKYELRETSYILVVYTPGYGKLRGVIKGIRSPYPQFAGNFEIFTRCEMVYYERKRSSLGLITHCECLDFYGGARCDIERLTYANYIIELVDVVTSENDPDERIYELLTGSLSLLSGKASARRVGRIFELKLLGATGLAPVLNGCVHCGKDGSARAYMDISAGGLVCGDCRQEGGNVRELSRGAVNFMKKVQSLPLAKVEHVKVSRQVGMETENVLNAFMEYHIARPVRSRDFMRSMFALNEGKTSRKI